MNIAEAEGRDGCVKKERVQLHRKSGEAQTTVSFPKGVDMAWQKVHKQWQLICLCEGSHHVNSGSQCNTRAEALDC